MDKYYYMVAQLPTLVFDREPVMDIKAFLEEAGKWLSRRDLKVLMIADVFGLKPVTQGPTVLKEYQTFEIRFRNALAEWRRTRRSGEELRMPGFPLSLVKEGNPLDVEKNLLKYRWDFIEAMEGGHDFDLELIILYYLKLQILQRLSVFDGEKGIAAYDGIVSAAMEDKDTSTKIFEGTAEKQPAG